MKTFDRSGAPTAKPVQGRLFELDSYRHQKRTMSQRLAIFTADFLLANPSASPERVKKAVDNHKKMLDRVWRSSAK